MLASSGVGAGIAPVDAAATSTTATTTTTTTLTTKPQPQVQLKAPTPETVESGAGAAISAAGKNGDVLAGVGKGEDDTTWPRKFQSSGRGTCGKRKRKRKKKKSAGPSEHMWSPQRADITSMQVVDLASWAVAWGWALEQKVPRVNAGEEQPQRLEKSPSLVALEKPLRPAEACLAFVRAIVALREREKRSRKRKKDLEEDEDVEEEEIVLAGEAAQKALTAKALLEEGFRKIAAAESGALGTLLAERSTALEAAQ